MKHIAILHHMKLSICKVNDNGKDTEYVLLKVEEDCNLSNYILYDETFDEEGNLSNKWPHMYRLKNLDVKKGEFVSIHTCGEEKYKKGKTNKGNDCHIFYRGLVEPIFNQEGDKAHLVQINDEVESVVTPTE